ncbi:MAG: hypothetical protein IPM37_09075 [Hahellaceae bacterium]|nr:hypothetical protein [Hahellaceae bacterium]
MYKRFFGVMLSLVLVASSAVAQDDLSKRAEQLKNRVADLNRQLMKLEEDTLAPIDTQVVVFLAVDADTDFELDAVELKLDDTLATHYLYSNQDRGALKRGGVQRLYMGALSEGGHSLQAVFNGRSSGDHYFRKAESLKFAKSVGATYLELRVKRDPGNPKLPRFVISELR